MKIDHLFKLVILGDLEVGKTSLILKFTEDSFNENPSLQVDFKIKLMTLENKGIKLQLWDTHVSEKSGKIDEAYINVLMELFLHMISPIKTLLIILIIG